MAQKLVALKRLKRGGKYIEPGTEFEIEDKEMEYFVKGKIGAKPKSLEAMQVQKQMNIHIEEAKEAPKEPPKK